MTIIGEAQPRASLVSNGSEGVGWFPHVQIEDLAAATRGGKKLGATALDPRTDGPAGTSVLILEPGGAVFAWFQARS